MDDRDDLPFSRSPYLALFLVFVQAGFLVLVYRKLPPQVPLLYSRPWGEEQLVSTYGLFLLPLLSLAIIGINRLILGFFPKEETFMAKVLEWASIIFSFLALISLFQIIRLVI